MAITGITLPTVPVSSVCHPDILEAVDVTVRLLTRLGCGLDEPTVRGSLAGDYKRFAGLGNGRLYVELPAAISHARLLALAGELAAAAQRSFFKPSQWAPYWVPGTQKGSVTEAELNGTVADFTARIALNSPYPADDPLLWFTDLPFDDKYARPEGCTQEAEVVRECNSFAAKHPGASLRAADHRDFLVWYLMDLLRDVPDQDIVLTRGFMRVPVLGRRAVVGDSIVGRVCSFGGRAKFGRDDGRARSRGGVGLVAGLMEA